MRDLSIQQKERRNFTLFITGRALSALVSSVYTFAVGLYVLKLTGSGLSFAITLCLQILPTVVIGPFAGILADKFNKKVLAVFTNTFCGALLIGLFLLTENGLDIKGIYGATLLLSVAQALYNLCISSAIPHIVSESNILKINSTAKIVDAISAIASPSIGGLLYVVTDIRFFILFNGIAFLLTALTESMIHFRLFEREKSEKKKLELKRDFIEGVSYIKATPWIRKALMYFLVLNPVFALSYGVPVPYILNNVYALPAQTYGILQCFMPAGMIVGALLVKRIMAACSYDKLMAAIGVFSAVGLPLLALPPMLGSLVPLMAAIPYYGVFMILFGIILSLIDIPFLNEYQTRVREDIRGRALSISLSCVKILTPMGYILSGILIERIPAFWLPLMGGGAIALFMVGVLRIKEETKTDSRPA